MLHVVDSEEPLGVAGEGGVEEGHLHLAEGFAVCGWGGMSKDRVEMIERERVGDE